MPSLADLSPLNAALEIFITAKEAERCSPRTTSHYRWTLDKFIRWLPEQGIHDADHITSHIVRAYSVHLQGQELAAQSVRDATRIIKTWLRFLYADGVLEVDRSARIAIPHADEPILPAFTIEDVRKLLDKAHGLRDQAIILCLLDSGCRVAEFVALDIGDVDIKSGAVHVREGKGGKQRMTYIGAKAKRALLKYLGSRTTKADEPLFLTAEGARLGVDGIQSMLTRLGKETGVDNCHPHTFRRTCALWSLRAGMNIFALQRLLGHSDLSILRRYLALIENDIEEAHRQYGAVDATL